MKLPALIPALLVVALPAVAVGGDVKINPKAVLELFTSQGCASCPPADALLTQLAQRPDVVALAYHVDYWDYIGWADTFGAKANSDRQRAYATAWNTDSIYTPELVVNGAMGVIGSRKTEIENAVAAGHLPIPVKLTVDAKNMLEVSIDGAAGQSESDVWLVTYIKQANVDVQRGENAGKVLNYSQVVTGRHILGMWDPVTGAHLKLPLDEVLTGPSDGAVILVQSDHNGLPGPIMGAASFVR